MRLIVTLAAAAAMPMLAGHAAVAAETVVVAETVVTDPAPSSTRRCGDDRQAGYAPAKPARSISRLGDMPPATHIKAVVRVFGGCPAPIVVARGVGNPQPGAKADDPASPVRIMPAGR